MATRTRKTSAPTVAELPVTRAMLGEVRTEVLQRIDQARKEAKVDAQRLEAKIDAVQAEVHEVKVGVHALQAQLVRIELLLEQQNAQNAIMLDTLTAILRRQDQVEKRVTRLEDTVRKLAAA